MKKAVTAITALALAMSSLPFSAAMTSAADGYDMNITIDFKGEKKAISPLIYGINQYGNEDVLKDLNVNAVRQGGNRMTAYNWENNASNAGSDWKHSSDNNLSDSDEPADCAKKLSALSEKNGIDYKFTTLQMAGYVSADKDGTVAESEAAPSARWNKVEFAKNAPFADTPDLTDGTVYMDEYVNYIVNALGNSNSKTGMQGYSLDNEPALWASTHSRMHPKPVTVQEICEKSTALASAVKKIDPDAEIFGPALYGYTAFDHLADDDSSNEWETVKAANNYHWYLDCYLDQMKKAEEDCGTRLLDVLDIHYYSESARVGAVDRVQSVRTLYEKGFSENSWIGQWCMENVPILPTVQKSIDTYYPGTKLAISEYNFGGGTDVSGTIAQAEALGCFADQGVYLATLWSGEPFIYSGIKLYTNYDGEYSTFGDTLLSTKTDDVSLSSSYASVNGSDNSLVTAMVTNKNMNESENAVINLNNSDKTYKSAAVYAVYGDSAEIRLIDKIDTIKNNKVEVTLPAFSAAMVVISDDADEFDDKELYDPDKFVTKTVDFDDPESLVNKNGYIELPVEDPEHISQIILTADVSSSAGSSWATAGCAVCINAKDSAGTGFWTSKSYSFGLGKDKTAVIDFDGTLKNADDEDIPAVIADGKVELQKWWDASEKAESDIEDIISVKYTHAQIVYQYENTQPTGGDDVIYGDADCSGDVALNDAVLILQSLANPSKYALSVQGKLNADCFAVGDGVDAQDALAVQQFLADLAVLPLK